MGIWSSKCDPESLLGPARSSRTCRRGLLAAGTSSSRMDTPAVEAHAARRQRVDPPSFGLRQTHPLPAQPPSHSIQRAGSPKHKGFSAKRSKTSLVARSRPLLAGVEGNRPTPEPIPACRPKGETGKGGFKVCLRITRRIQLGPTPPVALRVHSKAGIHYFLSIPRPGRPLPFP